MSFSRTDTDLCSMRTDIKDENIAYNNQDCPEVRYKPEEIVKDNTKENSSTFTIWKDEDIYSASNEEKEDSDYGEPTRTQHLRIDFSPIEGVDDDDFIFKKCTDFWALVDSHPSIHKLQSMPYSNEKSKSTTNTISPKHTEPIQSTAMQWLTRDRYMSPGSFNIVRQPMCEEDNTNIGWERKKMNGISTSAALNSDAAVLCRQLEAWDLSHPKSMKLPGPLPNLNHAVMLRGKSTLH